MKFKKEIVLFLFVLSFNSDKYIYNIHKQHHTDINIDKI